jgi:MYXO-CTERM domain-containing protein
MDFIEQLFGFAPDGGDGSLEFWLFAVPLAGICYLAFRRRQRRKRSGKQGAQEHS